MSYQPELRTRREWKHRLLLNLNIQSAKLLPSKPSFLNGSKRLPKHLSLAVLQTEIQHNVWIEPSSTSTKQRSSLSVRTVHLCCRTKRERDISHHDVEICRGGCKYKNCSSNWFIINMGDVIKCCGRDPDPPVHREQRQIQVLCSLWHHHEITISQ